MTEREKVIVGLTDSIEILSDFDTQEYTIRERQQLHGSVIAAIQDALALLKAQEPLKPVVDIDTWKCGNCGHTLENQQLLGDNVLFHEQYNYCPECGKAVKWDAQEQRDYEAAVEMAEYCERYEPTYNADDGSM